LAVEFWLPQVRFLPWCGSGRWLQSSLRGSRRRAGSMGRSRQCRAGRGNQVGVRAAQGRGTDLAAASRPAGAGAPHAGARAGSGRQRDLAVAQPVAGQSQQPAGGGDLAMFAGLLAAPAMIDPGIAGPGAGAARPGSLDQRHRSSLEPVGDMTAGNTGIDSGVFGVSPAQLDSCAASENESRRRSRR